MGAILYKIISPFHLHQVSFASELLIPMILYVALLILRGLYPPDYYPDRELNSFTKTNSQLDILSLPLSLSLSELYRPMGLPSAGLLPFAQTLICDLSTTNSSYSADMPVFPNAKYVVVRE